MIASKTNHVGDLSNTGLLFPSLPLIGRGREHPTKVVLIVGIHLLSLVTLVLNNKPNSMLRPQACSHVISCTPVTAPTRQPFHNQYTGNDTSMPITMISKAATSNAPTTANSLSMYFSYVYIIHSKGFYVKELGLQLSQACACIDQRKVDLILSKAIGHDLTGIFVEATAEVFAGNLKAVKHHSRAQHEPIVDT